MREITMSSLAVSKMMLHCYKYPHLGVSGVLLIDKSNEKETYISDCIPLFHQGLTLKPMFQVAMRQIEDYCNQNNLVIAGFYESPEVVKSAVPSPFAEKVGEKIREQFKFGFSRSKCCSFQVRRSKSCAPFKDAFLLHVIWHPDSQFAVRPFLKESAGDKWSYQPNVMKFENENVFQTILTLYKKNFFMEIQDFDCHLDNFANDWTNHSLHQLILLIDSQNESHQLES